MSKARVIVVGSFNQDHVWSTDALPQPGATRLGRYAGGPGGKGFNQAVAAARAGAKARFVTAVGEDAAARMLRELASAEGIDLRAQVTDLPSGAAGIFVDAEGRNVIVAAVGANLALEAGHVAAALDGLDAGCALLAQLEVATAAALHALQQARRQGALAILNPAPVDAPTSDALLAACEVLTPNETEFAALLARHAGVDVDAEAVAGLDDAALHQLCRRLPVDTCVVTLGRHGVFVSHADHQWRGDATAHYRRPACPARTLDTTGAGDAFNGALAAALVQRPGALFRSAIDFANRYAARATEQQGAALAMPRLTPADPA
ncbi:MAG: ribokinase [Lysobacteraceae bacterium]